VFFAATVSEKGLAARIWRLREVLQLALHIFSAPFVGYQLQSFYT